MAEAIMSEHLVSVDRQRLGVMLAATYRVDEEVDVLEQLCDVNGVSNHAWRRAFARGKRNRNVVPRRGEAVHARVGGAVALGGVVEGRRGARAGRAFLILDVAPNWQLNACGPGILAIRAI